MLSKNKIKLINSLEKKKFRDSLNLFLAEGEKIGKDILNSSYEIVSIAGTDDWFSRNKTKSFDCELIVTEKEELKKISFLKTTPEVIFLLKKKDMVVLPEHIKEKLTIVLDDIQDPGNLGTIIRLADWFGIENVICSPNSVDVYNPKVIQATMGAFCRVNVSYTPVADFLKECRIFENFEIYGTYLEGENIFQATLFPKGIIVMGNEGNGISEETGKFIGTKLNIPSFPPERPTSESLNISIATSIVCAEFRRRSF